MRNEYVQEIGLYQTKFKEEQKQKTSEEVEVYRRIRLSSNSTSDASYIWRNNLFNSKSRDTVYPAASSMGRNAKDKSPWEAQSNWVKWSRHLKRWGNSGSWDEVLVELEDELVMAIITREFVYKKIHVIFWRLFCVKRARHFDLPSE